MTVSSEMLSKLNLNVYFDEMKGFLKSTNDLNSLTKLLCEDKYSERKPYLFIRTLIPKDKRFKSIELVYDTPENVLKIRWNLEVELSTLIEYFGSPRFHYAPHGSSTMIGFFDDNGEFTGFESITPGNIQEVDKQLRVIDIDEKETFRNDLNLSFVSFKMEK